MLEFTLRDVPKVLSNNWNEYRKRSETKYLVVRTDETFIFHGKGDSELQVLQLNTSKIYRIDAGGLSYILFVKFLEVFCRGKVLNELAHCSFVGTGVVTELCLVDYLRER